MPYRNSDFVDDINQSSGMMEGKLLIFKKRGSAIRAEVDGEVEYTSHLFGDELNYRENGSKKAVTLSDIVSVNGIKYENYHVSY